MPNAMHLSPMPKAGGGKLVGMVGTAAAGLLVATVAMWEGKRNDPYADLAGIATVCYGETNVPMRRYTDAECQAMLYTSLADYAGPVLKRNPELRERPEMLAAASSLAYNIGTGAYSRSTIAKRFSAGQWKAACDGFLAWRFVGKREVKGLLNRRKHERALCLRGIK